jgi:glycine C-acetyltransferase
MDILQRIKEQKGPLGQYADFGEGYYLFPKLTGELSNRMIFDGKEVIVWSVNNYLGLGNDPEVRAVDAEAAKEWGMAYPMGSRMMSGNTDMHEELESQLADFVQKEKAVLVNFGYQGVMSAIDSILSRRDVVVYDSGCHACLVDGVRMHSGKRFVFKHNDMASLEKHLETACQLAESQDGGVLVISEGVFGMEGDQGKLKEIIDLKQKYDFRFLVDDAHGFGTLGETGAGAGEAQGVQDGIDIYFATFAKSMASFGAFLAGDKETMQFLKYNMRSQVFAKSLAMPVVIGNMKRLEMLRTRPEFKAKLWDNTNRLQSGLKEAGFNIGNTNSCVTPVYVQGSVNDATLMVKDLRENHRIFCSIVVYPVVAKGVILLRLIPTAVHNQTDIDETIVAFQAIAEKLRTNAYSSVPVG